MEKWIALIVVMALVRPLVWGGAILLLWAIGRALLPARAGRVIYGHLWDRRWRDVFLRAATGPAARR